MCRGRLWRRCGEGWLLPLVVVVTVALPPIQGYKETEEFINDLDKPVPMLDVQGVMGKKAALPCDIHPLAAEDHVSMVLWFKETDGEPLYSYDVRGRLVSQPKLWSSPSGFGSRAYFRAAAAPAVLLVDGVAPTDAGLYRCRVDFMNSPTRNLRVNFTVIIPPSRPTIVDSKTKDQTRLQEPYNEGDTLELSCEVYGGDPRPRVTWFLENTLIDDSFVRREDGVTVNALTFPTVGRQHLGARLVCQASNTNLAPPQTKILILDINLRPLTVQIVNKGRRLSADRTLDVECRSVGSRPDALLTWWKGNKQFKKNVRNFSEDNSTLSILTFVPLAEDHESVLACRAENLRLPLSIIEDRWILNVHYVPVVTLKLGSNLKADHIKEGDDVYFECSARANPRAHKLTWYKGIQEISHNASVGIILSDQSLVLQSVNRTAAGDYSCLAHNTEGKAYSNPVSLQVRYAPLCKLSEDGEVYGALKQETVFLRCAVDSNPSPTGFMWTFNNSGDQTELAPNLYSNYGFSSTLQYTPNTDMDFGTISCWAINSVGKQEVPCIYKLVAAGRPMSLQNCSIVNQSSNGVRVECFEGFDGGLPQRFFMEVLELPSLLMRANVSNNHTPAFELQDLDSRSSYILNLYAANAKGKSEVVSLYTLAIKSPDKYIGGHTSIPLSPVLASLLCAAALLAAAVCAVLAALYRRHAARAHRHDKRPPSSDGLYMDRSIESLSKLETMNTYTPSPKVEYCSQHELKPVDLGLLEETDPDIIPCHYDKRSCVEYSTIPESLSECVPPHATRLPGVGLPPSASSPSISVVHRGVTARSADIAAAGYQSSVVTTTRRVKESCI